MTTEQTPDSVPNKAFNFEDPRQGVVYDYLKRLVGEGSASFYKDACRHIATKPQFESTTHIVAHLLREIESALRDVLETIAEPIIKPPKTFEKSLNAISEVLIDKLEITEEIKTNLVAKFQSIEDQDLNSLEDSKSTHVNEIEVILKALNIKEDDFVAKAWLSLPGNSGLQKMTHRNNLEQARPLNQDFLDTWEKVNLILFTILEKFETQYIKIFQSLDKLAQKTIITKKDVEIIKLHIPNNRVAHERFFNTISSPDWLPLLESSDFFKFPPAPEKDLENNGVRYPTWPILIYLSRVASSSPDLVAKILLKIPDTENGNVKASMIETVTKLPKEKKVELIPQIKKWINSGGQFFGSMKSIELIKSLGLDNEIESALTLIREFLDFTPPVSVEINGYSSFRDPQPFIDSWHYGKFLDDDFPTIAKQDPINSIILLCELLSKYIDLDRADKKEETPQDYSYIGRPSIEKTEHLGREDADDSLIDAILTVSTEAVEKTPNLLKEIMIELRKQKWPVFNRIALYLLSKYPNINPEITIESLLNVDLIDSSDFDHEYALLVNSSFNLLSPEQKKQIFDFIDEAKDRKERIHQIPDPISDDQFERMVKIWQRNKLAIFDSYLDGEIKVYYDKLVTDLGQAENPRNREGSGVFVGPISDINADKINRMPPDELIELLKTWEPPKNNHGFGSSREGLGRELNIAVKKDVARFSTFAMSFSGLDPTYVRNYIQGFSEVVQNHVVFEWAPIIDLCLWIINQPREIESRTEKDGWDDEDPHWGWARRAVISLISNGLNNNAIPYYLHEKIWNIIEILSDDPNPNPEQELTREGTLVDDAYNLTINTVRGETMTAVVEYGLWITRLRDELPEDKRPELAGFALFPHVQSILEKHLTDPSIAVRAVYGRYFPWILLLGREWTIAHIKDIFPTGEFNTPLYDAAWETYIRYVSVYNDVFEILREQYLEAIKNIGTQDKKENRHNRDISLVEHLMIMFWRGKLDTTDIDGLFSIFWKTANEETRAYAIDFLGRSLHSLTEPIGDAEAKLLKELWEVRIKEAETAEDKKTYEKEMSGFGWWFASGKLEEDWSIKEFLRSLEISKKVNGDYSVIDRLVVLAKSKPHESIKILGKLVQRDRQQWILFGNENDLRDILATALNSNNTLAQTETRDLINRLVAWGYSNYGSLLLPPTPPEIV